MPIDDREHEKELERSSIKPTIVDDILQKYYEVIIEHDKINEVKQEITGLKICLNKKLINSIFKSKKDRISFEHYKNNTKYEFTIRLKPTSKYINENGTNYRLSTYNIFLPTIPEEFMKNKFLYYNCNQYEALIIDYYILVDENLNNFFYQEISKNTKIFKSKMLYDRIVIELNKRIDFLNNQKMITIMNPCKIGTSINQEFKIDVTSIKVTQIFNDFLNDYIENKLPLSLKSYIGIDDKILN
jgi:hypothetical protein